MAGETQKSTALTNRDNGKLRRGNLVKGQVFVTEDTHQFAAATELEAGDNLILDMPIPSNARVLEILHINDDLDTNGTPTLVVDIGLAAAQDYTSVTSSTETKHLKDAIIDADLFVDGNTAFQAATTTMTSIAALDATTFGPEDQIKPIWELLGYDEDPRTIFNIVFQSQAASATLGAAGDLILRVLYTTD
jgi:hypothetical protein